MNGDFFRYLSVPRWEVFTPEYSMACFAGQREHKVVAPLAQPLFIPALNVGVSQGCLIGRIEKENVYEAV